MTTAPMQTPHRNVGIMRPARYIPLAVVTAATLVTGIIGFGLTAGGATANKNGTPAPAPAPPVLDIVEGTTDPVLPSTCRIPLDQLAKEPWAPENAAASDAVWTANSAFLGQAFVEGEDGFVFWGDIQNNNFSQAVGRRTLSQAELQQWIDSLRTVRDQLAEAGIAFYVVPSPGKWDVYPEKLPAWARSIDGSGPLDQLLAAAPDLPIIDLRADLRAAATTVPVYSTVNSHWSDYGAWVGWQTISRCIASHDEAFAGIDVPAIDDIEITEGGNEFAQWGFSAPQPDWSVPVLAEPLLPTIVMIDGERSQTRTDEQRLGLEEMPASTLTPDAQSPLRLLLVRDSMGVSLSPWAQQSFEQTRQIRHAFDLGDPALIPNISREAIDNNVDIVIVQFAQRHLNAPPDLTEGG